LDLHGFVYRPAGPGPHPAVLFNHGGGPRDPEPAHHALGPRFAAMGYLFFAPERRGRGQSPGEYLATLIPHEADPQAEGRLRAAELEIELFDVMAALRYLEARPDVDSADIIMAGWSTGAALTLLAAERAPDLRAAITFASPRAFWSRSPEMQARLLAAAREIRTPTLLIQAENDLDLTPTMAISGELERQGVPHTTLIYPPFGISADEGQAFCALLGTDICWPDIAAFLRETVGGPRR